MQITNNDVHHHIIQFSGVKHDQGKIYTNF